MNSIKKILELLALIIQILSVNVLVVPPSFAEHVSLKQLTELFFLNEEEECVRIT